MTVALEIARVAVAAADATDAVDATNVAVGDAAPAASSIERPIFIKRECPFLFINSLT